ncbi:esterase [Parabacteroides sp. PF5-9]|uniref:esterase n=1 Tax=Parabacteroides sp. PF5-9 TaxID=1742404 RepID=UPI002473799B|nr:esterase [Parabacteroides sp. PF5-9]MDH6357929.1 enterochelin esterase-like enzyme [Parabacteroides sp. PF5-9]
MSILFILLFFTLTLTQAVGQQQQVPHIISPEVMNDNSVVFRLRAPNATSVIVNGTFPDARKEMTKNAEGVFEYRTTPITPDMYTYTFSVDGVKATDPSNNIVVRDGSHIESRLMIPGGITEVIDVKDVPHGKLSAVWYPSPTLGKTRRMMVYTPPGYDTSNESYPVLYLLHGAGGDEEAWVSRGRTNYILDNLIAQGKAVPMIVVIPNGNASATSAPGETPLSIRLAQDAGAMAQAGAMVGSSVPDGIVKDIIPFIEANYRVKANKENRALSGLSMGGYQTQMTSNAYPNTFNYIGVMSMGLMSTMGEYNKDNHIAQLKALQAANPKLYWIACGTTDFLYQSVLDLIKLYDEIGFKYIYRESEGGHTWNNWRLYLSEFAPMLFK